MTTYTRNRPRKQCSQGHPFTEDSAAIGPSGRRTCLICTRGEIDWQAVEWVCEGTRMKLNRAEKKAVAKRLYGRLPAWKIAELIGARNRKFVERLQAEP